MNSHTLSRFNDRHVVAIVWTLRVILGAVFVMSGFVKMVDVWGFIYKMEQYLNVWAMPMPRSITFFTAMVLCAAEFLLGFLLMFGCYKRVVVWLMALMMAFMLPLTAWIMIADPVADCGCFGDFWIISNTATFLKNLAITAGIVYLLVYNRRVAGLFTAYSQWLVVFLSLIYIAVIGFFGYFVQPLLEFRHNKTGESIVTAAGSMADELPMTFIYEKDGERRSFTDDNLPDSTWTFVDRVMADGDSADDTSDDGIAILDEFGDDVSSEVISSDGLQVLLLIPELNNVDVSSTYLINAVNRYVNSIGGSMIGILGTTPEGLESWRDISLASYPLYTSDDTAIKELARGNVSLVYLRDGVIMWKRSLASIDSDIFDADSLGDDLLDKELAYSGRGIMVALTIIFFALLLVLWVIDRSGRAVKLRLSRRYHKNNE